MPNSADAALAEPGNMRGSFIGARTLRATEQGLHHQMIMIIICKTKDAAMTPSPNLAMTITAIQGIVHIDSRQLFVAGPEVRVLHNGQEYRLRITASNKLILTK